MKGTLGYCYKHLRPLECTMNVVVYAQKEKIRLDR